MIAIDWLKEKTGFKRIPPICYPLVAPFFITFFLCLGCYIVVRWLFGFWTCNYCERKYSIRDEKHKVHSEYNDWGYNKCLACLTTEKLTGEQLEVK